MDVNVAVLDVLEVLGPSMSQDIRTVSQLDRELPMVKGDPGQLHQVIMNLCLNAADAMPDGGRLSLSTSSQHLDQEFSEGPIRLLPGRYVNLTVTDTGAGMDQELRSKIFEPFFTTKAASRGTGLGLSIALGIVKEHGGEIRVSSQPGQGSSFCVYLPVWDPPNGNGPVQTEPPP